MTSAGKGNKRAKKFARRKILSTEDIATTIPGPYESSDVITAAGTLCPPHLFYYAADVCTACTAISKLSAGESLFLFV